MSSRLQVRKIFIYQAGAPLVYNLGIVLGAFFLHRQIRHLLPRRRRPRRSHLRLLPAQLHRSLPHRLPLPAHPSTSASPAFLEWFKLTLPLMIGVSLVMFDGFFLNYFASIAKGGITLIGNAKDLFNAPFNVIGPAAGAASLPFFASLFQQRREFDFSASVGRTVSRLFAVGMLVSAWMIALAPWLLNLFKGGKFNRADVLSVTHLFQILSITLAIWAVQGIYARAFYAASDTKTPAITGTIITILSIPMYWALFNARGLTGLAIASDIGIFVQTATLAILLHRKRLVSLSAPRIRRASPRPRRRPPRLRRRLRLGQRPRPRPPQPPRPQSRPLPHRHRHHRLGHRRLPRPPRSPLQTPHPTPPPQIRLKRVVFPTDGRATRSRKKACKRPPRAQRELQRPPSLPTNPSARRRSSHPPSPTLHPAFPPTRCSRFVPPPPHR